MLRILAGILVGSIFALTLPDIGALSMLGDLFVGALKAIAPVLVAVLVTSSVVTITVMTLATCHTMGIVPSLGSALLLSIVATFGACGASGVAGGSLLLIPMACSLFGISNDVAMQVVAVGFIIGVVQDSVETALNSSGDAFFTIATDMRDRMRRNEKK